MRYTTFTERGCRSDNEDYCQVVIDNDAGRHLFVVCDGMGGHAMGEVASRVVGTAICEYWEQASFGEDVEQVLANAFQRIATCSPWVIELVETSAARMDVPEFDSGAIDKAFFIISAALRYQPAT